VRSLILLALLACNNTGRVSATGSAGSAATSVDDTRFKCATDPECMNSCAYGAVNTAWYARQTNLRECQDGCANQIAAPPRCERGTCVAYQVDPSDRNRITRRDDCTQVRR
jgi:hypothetical protein